MQLAMSTCSVAIISSVIVVLVVVVVLVAVVVQTTKGWLCSNVLTTKEESLVALEGERSVRQTCTGGLRNMVMVGLGIW